MAPDERDRNFDSALARHLRSTAPGGEAAGVPEIPPSQSAVCPDPETLAAYHERSLLPEEMNSWKEHIVGCANCQTVLSHLEATEEISLQAFAEKEAVTTESEPVMAARNRETLHGAAAPSPSQRAAGAAPPKKSRRVLLLRGARWRWLAPAGALAAGLLVWIALHENHPRALPSLKEVQVATNQPPPPAAPPVSTAVQQASPPEKTAITRPRPAVDEFTRANTSGSSDTIKSREKQDYLAQVPPPKPLANVEGGLRKDAERGSSDELLRAENQMDRDAKSVPGANQETAEVQMQAQTANAQLQNQSPGNSSKVAGPAPLGQIDNKKKEMKAARAAAAREPAAAPAAGLTAATSMLEVVTVSNPRLIAPPGSSVMWRAGRHGLIELSKDGGSSWARQTSGVLADLLTGFAPSDQVCWIVGRAGTILRTTDGGAHWQKVRSPVLDDLGSVFAVDAQQATVSPAHGSYQTTDGGVTWNKLAPE